MISPNQCQCVPVEQCPSYNSGGQQGGNVPYIPPGGETAPPYGGDGQHGGNIPVIGGGGDGQHGGNIPIISGGEGVYGLGGGQQGGNIPVSGGGGDGLHGGNIPVIGDPGYGGGDAGAAPNTDGSGLLDLRIVNRPPRPGGVQCLNGNIFCCDTGEKSPPPISGQPDYPNPGPGGSGGYVTCGARNFIDVPGKSLEYGDVC